MRGVTVDSGGSVHFAADVAAATVVSESSPVYNVTHLAYGADKTGTVDSLPAIQLAIAAACASGGGRIYFPSGSYKLSNGIVLSCDNLELFGDGLTTVFPIALEQQFASPNRKLMAGAGVFMGINLRNIYIHDMFVNGQNTSTDGKGGLTHTGTQRAVSINNGTNITIQRLRVNGMQSENLYVENAVSTKIRYLDNYITNARFDALNLNYASVETSGSVTGSDNLISGNTVDGAAKCVEGPAGWTLIVNNVFLNCTVNGAIITPNSSSIDSKNRTEISGNIFRGDPHTLSTGLTLAGSGVIAHDNDISGFGETGIFIVSGSSLSGRYRGTYQLVSHNMLHGNGTYTGGSGADIWVNGEQDAAAIHGNMLYQENGTSVGILVSAANNHGLTIDANKTCGYATPILDPSNRSIRFGNTDCASTHMFYQGAGDFYFAQTGNTVIGANVSTGFGKLQTTGDTSQLRYANSKSKGMGSLTAIGNQHSMWCSGADYNGVSFVARYATASCIGTNDGGVIIFYSNIGLAIGSTFAPTEVGRIENGGLTLGGVEKPGSGVINAANGYKSGGVAGYTGTKTIGSCVLTIRGGIITGVSGC
jgi:hypothetical protein